MGNSNVVKTIAQKLFPFIMLFGIYLILNGHLSPGGGFQGGVVLGTAIILLALSYGIDETERKFKSKHLSVIEKSGILFFIFLGDFGIIFRQFLSQKFPSLRPGGTDFKWRIYAVTKFCYRC